jgi:hypothetical protein
MEQIVSVHQLVSNAIVLTPGEDDDLDDEDEEEDDDESEGDED